ncbi:Short-chain dehydrogenase/reductase SDR [Penicillium hordei]|jgi:Dehydrogenases with different specificities (related to short-chain alcohol dehydrogenases)|uniref:Short-chain dehydrogenase/reductase SDR n=1 Tax=Penicillium hordei TaxID=40994 RepID=A0AAD6H6K6_9EURO|nr:Short-chain dehydrogenase/reductase SDR [Penicillium hordei]KAJ5608310.1 Short-chain dehydrogenase/reductase SDR [Penicillium hordei]
MVICDIQDNVGQNVASGISSKTPNTKIKYEHLDATFRSECHTDVEAAVRFLGGQDSLIHAAGHIHQDAAETIAEDELDRMLDVNIEGVIFMNQAVFPYLKTRGGTILNFGSDLASEPLPLLAHYTASKGAVQSFTRAVAREWGKYGIRVNAVLPAVWTPMIDGYRGNLETENVVGHDVFMNDRVCLGETFGDVEIDLVPVLAFLVSDASRWITGQLVPANGGLSLVR